MIKMLAALAALALASMALVACGGDDDTTTTGGGETTGTTDNGAAEQGATAGGGQAGGKAGAVVIEADPNGGLAYTPEDVSAEAGTIDVDFKNPQSLVHDVVFEESGGKEIGRSELITAADEEFTLKNVKPGDYPFYCSVPGHREAGMEGTLTVE